MASDDVGSQLQDIREQLDVQAEAISKLAGVISAFDGVDSSLLGSYVLRLKRLHGPANAPPTAEAPVSAPAPSEPEPGQAVPH
jgi:hypothetical protein